jgi:hypothetical protein
MPCYTFLARNNLCCEILADFLLQSCAATLAQRPDKFKVTIIERMSMTGGQATSTPLDKDKYGAEWLNDGVQGGS